MPTSNLCGTVNDMEFKNYSKKMTIPMTDRTLRKLDAYIKASKELYPFTSTNKHKVCAFIIETFLREKGF